MGVSDTHADYDKFSRKWKRVRDVMAGQDAVHDAGTQYLPKLKEQSESGYNAYRMRANFYNASARTVSGLLGMLFRKEAKIKVPSGMDDMLKDIDMEGTSFSDFSKHVADDCLKVGRVGLMIDYPLPPQVKGVMSVAVAEQIGLRPMLKFYSTESAINWKTRRINNRTLLSLVVLMEQVAVPKDEFKDEFETHYRVLDLNPATNTYRIRVFKVNAGGADEQIGGDIVPLLNGVPLTEIPFIFVTPNGVETKIEEPPLLDLVDINLAHYRVSADYEHGCHFSGLPTAVITGHNSNIDDKTGKPTETFYIGSETAWVFSEPQARADFLQVTGGFEPLEKNLDRKESQMAILGARMIAPEKKQAETATTTAIHRTGENAILSDVAIHVSDALEKALGVIAKWIGIEPTKDNIEYELNRDFVPALVDAPMLIAAVKAWQASAMSFEDMYALFQRGDITPSEKTVEEARKEIETNPPPAPEPPKPAPGAPKPTGAQPPAPASA